MSTPQSRAAVIHVALSAYRAETDRYLLSYTSWPLTSPYDPACCGTCRGEHMRWETSETTRKALVERLRTIDDALVEVAR